MSAAATSSISSSEATQRAFALPSSGRAAQPHYSNAALKIEEAPIELPAAPLEQEHGFRFADLHFVGQIFGCYLLCEHAEKFYIVDMHAAHERLNYNLLRPALDGPRLASQGLLVPLTVELSEQGAVNCAAQIELFERFGFELVVREDHSVEVRAIPAMLVGKDIAALVKDVAAVPEDMCGKGRFKERFDLVAARIACHASVRSGRILNRSEALALFESMDGAQFSAACPHGRPVVVSFREAEVEKWFGRDR